jgi:hypothetical protein
LPSSGFDPPGELTNVDTIRQFPVKKPSQSLRVFGPHLLHGHILGQPVVIFGQPLEDFQGDAKLIGYRLSGLPSP